MDGVLPTPLEPAPPGLAPGREVWLKREDVHELGAFKWRGAMPTLRTYHEQLHPPTCVIVPVGNGALLIGVGSALGEAAPRVQRVGVVAAAAPVMALSHQPALSSAVIAAS